MEIPLTKELYTINEIVKLFPRCTNYMVVNYRWKYKVGKKIHHRVYFTNEEVQTFIETIELDFMKRRTYMYEFIKFHPGILDRRLFKYIEWTPSITAKILADISEKEYLDQFPDLYEDDNDRQYIKGFELVKKYTKEHGIFYQNKTGGKHD